MIGQNLVDHQNFDDFIVSRLVEKVALNGIDVFRIFDTLNDVRNPKTSVEAVKKARQARSGCNLLWAESSAHDPGARRPGAADQGNGLPFHLRAGR